MTLGKISTRGPYTSCHNSASHLTCIKTLIITVYSFSFYVTDFSSLNYMQLISIKVSILWNAKLTFTQSIKEREKGRDLTQSYDKSPYTHRKIQKATRQHKNATKNFNYTTIADRLRTVSGSNNIHPNGEVKPVCERSTFSLTALNSRVIERTHIWKIVNNPPYSVENNQTLRWGRDSGIPSSCPRFATSTTRQASSWITNLGHSDGIPSSLPQCGVRFY